MLPEDHFVTCVEDGQDDDHPPVIFDEYELCCYFHLLCHEEKIKPDNKKG